MRQTMKRNNFTMESTLYAKSWFVEDFELKLCEFILRGVSLQRYQNGGVGDTGVGDTGVGDTGVGNTGVWDTCLR